jgi:hypothetical protein
MALQLLRIFHDPNNRDILTHPGMPPMRDFVLRCPHPALQRACRASYLAWLVS